MKKEFKLNKSEIGEVLQRLYDSEINLTMGWLWDMGITYSLETNTAPLSSEYDNIEYTGQRLITDAFETIVRQVLSDYPQSEFTRWFVELKNIE